MRFETIIIGVQGAEGPPGPQGPPGPPGSHASEIIFEPAGNLSSINVQDALEELDAEKAGLDEDGLLSPSVIPIEALRHVNPELHFGCIGDGVTDDTGQMLVAIQEAAARGFWVDLGGLTYGIAGLHITGLASVKIRNGKFLDINPGGSTPGTGRKAIFIEGIGVANVALQDWQTRVVLDHVILDRNGSGADDIRIATSGGIWIEEALSIELYACEVFGNDRGQGIFVGQSSKAILDNCHVHDIYYDPTFTYTSGEDPSTEAIQGFQVSYVPNVVIRNCTAERLGHLDQTAINRFAHARGFNLQGGDGNLITGCRAAHCATGIELGGGEGGSRFKMIENSMDRCLSFGSKIGHGVCNSVIADNIIEMPGQCGFVQLSDFGPSFAGGRAGGGNQYIGNVISNPGWGYYEIGGQSFIDGTFELDDGSGTPRFTCGIQMEERSQQGCIGTGNRCVHNREATNFSVLTNEDGVPAFTIITALGASLSIENGLRVRLTTTGTFPTVDGAALAAGTNYYIGKPNREFAEEGLAGKRDFLMYRTFYDAVFGLNPIAGLSVGTGSGTHTITVQSNQTYEVYNTVVQPSFPSSPGDGVASNKWDPWSNTGGGSILGRTGGEWA